MTLENDRTLEFVFLLQGINEIYQSLSNIGHKITITNIL